MEKRKSKIAWVFVTPALLVLGFVAVLPLMIVVNYSFHDIFTMESRVWVGLEWYVQLLGSDRFWQSFGRSLIFTGVVLAIEVPLGIFIAVFLPKKGVPAAFCLVAISLPLLVPWNMIAMIWHIFLSPDFLGGTLISWVIDSRWTLNAPCTWAAIVLMDVWHWTSLVILLCYSGLTTIPPAFYQAGAIDGASRWHIFRYIELPKIRAVLTMAVMLRFIDSFMVYTEPFVLNAGGPKSATTLLAMELGREFVSFNYGPAAARSVVYFIIIATITWTFKTMMNARDAQTE